MLGADGLRLVDFGIALGAGRRRRHAAHAGGTVCRHAARAGARATRRRTRDGAVRSVRVRAGPVRSRERTAAVRRWPARRRVGPHAARRAAAAGGRGAAADGRRRRWSSTGAWRGDPEDRFASMRDVVAGAGTTRARATCAGARPLASAAAPATTVRSASGAAREHRRRGRWWDVHQAVTAALYVGLLWPGWLVASTLPARWTAVAHLALVCLAAIATSLRLHLWFSARHYPEPVAAPRRSLVAGAHRRRRDLRRSARVAWRSCGRRPPLPAVVTAGLAVCLLMASLVIEPATTAPAYGRCEECEDSETSLARAVGLVRRSSTCQASSPLQLRACRSVRTPSTFRAACVPRRRPRSWRTSRPMRRAAAARRRAS